MRTRSVQLVTSWWVVGVWAALSLATGLVSVVAVLQPAWYVRYSQIHAQDAQGVAFQVSEWCGCAPEVVCFPNNQICFPVSIHSLTHSATHLLVVLPGHYFSHL